MPPSKSGINFFANLWSLREHEHSSWPWSHWNPLWRRRCSRHGELFAQGAYCSQFTESRADQWISDHQLSDDPGPRQTASVRTSVKPTSRPTACAAPQTTAGWPGDKSLIDELNWWDWPFAVKRLGSSGRWAAGDSGQPLCRQRLFWTEKHGHVAGRLLEDGRRRWG